jgi:hypothetical protein
MFAVELIIDNAIAEMGPGGLGLNFDSWRFPSCSFGNNVRELAHLLDSYDFVFYSPRQGLVFVFNPTFSI